MKLPNAQLAVVEQQKILGYLLNLSHRDGASKARFFLQFGFRVTDWGTLARALRDHGRQFEVSRQRATGFGPSYDVDGPLETPDGRRPRVRTVWQIDHGQIAPRLITAYPAEAHDD
jgi:hypothetical protein